MNKSESIRMLEDAIFRCGEPVTIRKMLEVVKYLENTVMYEIRNCNECPEGVHTQDHTFECTHDNRPKNYTFLTRENYSSIPEFCPLRRIND